MTKHRVLVIEDSEINTEIMVRRLEKHPVDILTAEDGSRLFSLLQTFRPDIILMDLSLPHRDGWSLTRDIRANADTAHIPIIAVSAHAMVGDREKALEAGCDEYESKPVNFRSLFHKMEELVPGLSMSR